MSQIHGLTRPMIGLRSPIHGLLRPQTCPINEMINPERNFKSDSWVYTPHTHFVGPTSPAGLQAGAPSPKLGEPRGAQRRSGGWAAGLRDGLVVHHLRLHRLLRVEGGCALVRCAKLHRRVLQSKGTLMLSSQKPCSAA